MVRGYHTYKEIWDAPEREYVRENENLGDPFAIPVSKILLLWVVCAAKSS